MIQGDVKYLYYDINPRVQRGVLIIFFTPMRLDYCRPKLYMIFMFHELSYRSQHQTLCEIFYQCQFSIFICIYNMKVYNRHSLPKLFIGSDDGAQNL